MLKFVQTIKYKYISKCARVSICVCVCVCVCVHRQLLPFPLCQKFSCVFLSLDTALSQMTMMAGLLCGTLSLCSTSKINDRKKDWLL